jgi:long-chain acyl-CoA synthetase
VTNRNFDDFVAGFKRHDERLAMTLRPFLKVERLTYRELQERAYQTANYLLARAVRSGDRVMVVAGNSPDWVELFLGTQLIGAILVPVDASGTSGTTLKLMEQTEPKLIFRNKHLHAELDGLASVEFIEDLKEHISEYPTTPPAVRLMEDDPAIIVFTSGTTADPKGVVLTQKNMLSNVEGALRMLHVGPDWRFLSVLPLSHMYELTGGMLAPLSNGASIFYVPSASPLAIARALQDYHITSILAVPELLILMLKQINQAAAAEGKQKALALASELASRLPFALRRLLFTAWGKIGPRDHRWSTGSDRSRNRMGAHGCQDTPGLWPHGDGTNPHNEPATRTPPRFSRTGARQRAVANRSRRRDSS